MSTKPPKEEEPELPRMLIQKPALFCPGEPTTDPLIRFLCTDPLDFLEEFEDDYYYYEDEVLHWDEFFPEE
jgi:hypothetical protein